MGGKNNFDEDDMIVFDEPPPPSGAVKKGIDLLKERFVKHVRCTKGAKAKVQGQATTLTIVSKERDSVTGVETLKTQKLNYGATQSPAVVAEQLNFDKVREAAKSERIGAQSLALKATLKEKIAEKRRQERQKNANLKKIDNEEEDSGENTDGDENQDEDEEILDDEDITEDEEEEEVEDSEEEEDEIDFDSAAGKERRRVKASCSFLNDEAEDDDDNDDDEEEDELILTKKDRETIDAVVSGVLDEGHDLPDTEELEAPAAQEAAAVAVEAPSPFSSFLGSMDPGNIRWTPLSQQTQAPEKNKSAKKKLGFDDLFDVSGPQVDDMGDVVGLLSGQFATQKPSQDDEDNCGSQLSQEDEDLFGKDGSSQMNETPDTVILTNKMNQTPDTVILTNKPTGESQTACTPDTQILSDRPTQLATLTEEDDDPEATQGLTQGVTESQEDTQKVTTEAEETRTQPGFMEEDCGFNMVSSDDEMVGGGESIKKKKMTKKKVR